MIQAIIIEDEPNVLEVLKKMLQLLYPELNIIGEAGSVAVAIPMIKDLKPQLVFMDIQLEDGTGFDILEQIDLEEVKVIFTTAYNEYAIKAFKFSAVDYLLKPINPEELNEAVKRAVSSINEKESYKELLAQINTNKTETIVLKTADKRYVIPINSIIHLEAEGAYTTFVTINEKLVISKNIKYYQELLDKDFIRCHQSHLVHKAHIKSFDSDSNVQLSNGDIIPVSRRNKGLIEAILNK